MTNEQVLEALHQLIQRVEQFPEEQKIPFERIHPNWISSAYSLLHYTALRQYDLIELQHALADMGLSSLGRSEGFILSHLRRVAQMLESSMQMDPTSGLPQSVSEEEISREQSRSLNQQHSHDLFDDNQHGMNIMVTMPTEAADDESKIKGFLTAGMNVMRINTAHDTPEQWKKMIVIGRHFATSLSLPLKICLDLAGPKIRTGQIRPLGEFIHLSPPRDPSGKKIGSAYVTLCQEQNRKTGQIAIEEHLLEQLQIDDRLRFKDSRNKNRQFKIINIVGNGENKTAIAKTESTVYAQAGCTLTLKRDKQDIAQGQISALDLIYEKIHLHAGDSLLLTASDTVGQAADTHTPASIPCSHDGVLEALEENDPVFFDDAKIQCRVIQKTAQNIELKVERCPPKGAVIKPEKGINAPHTHLRLDTLTSADIENVRQLGALVDCVSLSYIQSDQDVLKLYQKLEDFQLNDLSVILKIENQHAFHTLPRILLAAMQRPSFGVMIARGDLGAELGFERLSEAQEEISAFCDSAHVPVIWATQVLDNLAKKGLPTRSEVSDVVMACRTEAIMLNKGPHVNEAIKFIIDINRRMARHQQKKNILLRKLSVSHMFAMAG